MQLAPPQPMAPKSLQICALGFVPIPLALKQGSVSVFGLHSSVFVFVVVAIRVVVVVVVAAGVSCDVQLAASEPASPMSVQLAPPQPMAPKSLQVFASGFEPGPLDLKQGSVSVIGVHSFGFVVFVVVVVVVV